jgi:hypothetical protein
MLSGDPVLRDVYNGNPAYEKVLFVEWRHRLFVWKFRNIGFAK